MDNIIHRPIAATRRVSTKSRKGHHLNQTRSEADVVSELASAGTLTRTKSLMRAALRVWELKQGIRD